MPTAPSGVNILAGLYFGVIYLIRGFGIVVAVHAFYDILTVAIMHEQASL